MHQILIRPLITEKMSNLTADQNKYGFLVIPSANKIEIAKAIQDKFDVHVVDIRTVNHPGKTKTQFRKGGRFTGKTARYKKAIVTLREGETIDLFEEV
ncbi:MAG: 50S ribosomal protein L23 [Bacteroidetes bacterium]|nr:50S ribosomal protein L23 [Bacteroidota bacterium]MCH7723821.1 50S ribosomal protein L23 [Bacteroidota bacterium]MCH9028604.1 50S ribosomal protein L23 [Bacteroidota bacterium]